MSQRATILFEPDRLYRGKTANERFWSRVNKTETCWLWTGARNPVTGYAMVDGCYVHRVSYEIHKGAIPPGLLIDHLCRVRHCLNPDHLEAVTNRENCLRGDAPTVQIYRSGSCSRGHLQAEWGYPKRNGGYQCRKCDQDRAWQNVPVFTSICPGCGNPKTQRWHPQKTPLCKSCGCKVREERKRLVTAPVQQTLVMA